MSSRRDRRKILGGWWLRRRQNRALGKVLAELESKWGPADPEVVAKIVREWANDAD